MNLNRRSFILAGGGALVAHAAAPSDQVTMGVIGVGSRGTFVMQTFQKDTALKVGAICDVYEPNLEHGIATAAKGQNGVAPKLSQARISSLSK